MDRPKGNIKVCPMAGWATGTLPEKKVLLEVQFITHPSEKAKDARSLNFAIGAFQANELGQALQRAALEALERSEIQGK